MKTGGIIALAAAVLVGASGVCYYVDRSPITSEKVLAVTDPYEFVAVTEGTYDNGVLTVEVQTNAPDGAVFDVYAHHPDLEESCQGQTVVEKGVGTVTIDFPTDLATQYITVYAAMDMAKQTNVTRYGLYGEKMTGDSVVSMDGVYNIGLSSEDQVCYPSEEAVMASLNEEFPRRINNILLSYSSVLAQVLPGEGEDGQDDWTNMTIVFTDRAVEAWDEFVPGLQEQYYRMFDMMVRNYKQVPEGADVRVTFTDLDGNVLDQNYDPETGEVLVGNTMEYFS